MSAPYFAGLGLDLSLTSTGLAVVDPVGYHAWTARPPRGMTGHDRLAWILDQIWDIAYSYEGGHRVVVEGPSYGSQAGQKGHHERAGLWWLVTQKLWAGNVQYVVMPPSALKKYATGKGNASKDEVLLATAKRFPAFNGGNDAADALWLAAAGADHLGHPPVVVPAAQRAALAKVDWPVA